MGAFRNKVISFVTRFERPVRNLCERSLMRVLLLDIRYAIRLLLKWPGLTITALVSLAVGIGANTAIFSMLDAVFWRSLPVREPYRLVRVGVLSRAEGRIRGLPGDVVTHFLDITRNRVFSGLLTYSTDGLSLDAGGRAESSRASRVGQFLFSDGRDPVRWPDLRGRAVGGGGGSQLRLLGAAVWRRPDNRRQDDPIERISVYSYWRVGKRILRL